MGHLVIHNIEEAQQDTDKKDRHSAVSLCIFLVRAPFWYLNITGLAPYYEGGVVQNYGRVFLLANDEIKGTDNTVFIFIYKPGFGIS